METERQPLETDEIWRSDRVTKETGLSESTRRRKVRKGEFPAPLDLGDRSKGWLASEIIEWRRTRPRRWLDGIGKPVAERKNKPHQASAHNEDSPPTESTAGHAEVASVIQPVPA